MKPVNVQIDPELKEYIRRVSLEGRTSWEELRIAETLGNKKRIEMARRYRLFIEQLDLQVYGRILSEEESVLLIAKKRLHSEIEM
jgi:hypothetical protein